MVDFMNGLLDLVFFVFHQSDNVVVIIPFTVLYFCFTFTVIRKLMRR